MTARVVVVGAAGLVLSCSSSSTAAPSMGRLCGTSMVEDVVTVDGRDFPIAPRHDNVCADRSDCGGGVTSYVLRDDCWLEIDAHGAVTPGTTCKRTFSDGHGVEQETLITTGGTAKTTGGALSLDVTFDRRTRADDGSETRGRSSWSLLLTESGGGTPKNFCGKRGAFPDDDFRSLVGCAETDIVDLSADSADRTVRFGGDVGSAYSPQCLRIAPGQSVSFVGDFAQYVLAPGTLESATAGTQPNPVVFRPVGTAGSFVFPEPGDFVFHCSSKPGLKMLGMVRVRK